MTTTAERQTPQRPEMLFDEQQLLARARANDRLVVACILDEFSAQCFSPEADFVPLTPKNWEVELCASQPDLLLVESAWRGHRELWWNTIPRLDPELQGILAWCRERGVPTAFWNKEDPVHFATFLTVAAEFDSVFTTDMDCVPLYKARLGHERVHFLPFAAQPALHNPLESFERTDGTAFAGAYYRRYPERTADLDALSRALRRRGPLAIYDRNHAKQIAEYAFPEEFHDEIVGGLAPHEIGVAYKGYTYNLNLNSVKQSQSMFARRVYELMASNTLVVSNFSRGLRSMFGDLVVATDSAAEVARVLDRLERIPHGVERVRAAALRKVLSDHTYGERLAFIARVNNVATQSRVDAGVLVVADVANVTELESVREAVNRQTWKPLKVAVHANGALAAEKARDEVLGGWANAELVLLSSMDPATVQVTAEKAGCEFVSVFDPSDYYGPNYVTDATLALGWSSLPAAGKGRHFAATTQGPMLSSDTGSFTSHPTLPARASVIRLSALPSYFSAQRIDAITMEGLAIDPFNYCRGGAALPVERMADVLDLELDRGHGLDDMRRHAALATVDVDDNLGIAVSELLDGLEGRSGEIRVDTTGPLPTIISTLAPGKHRYVYSSKRLQPNVLDLARDRFVYFECAPGLDLTLTFLFMGSNGQRLGHVMVPNLINVGIDLPPGTVELCVGLRVLGPGRATVKRFIPHHHHEANSGVLTRARDLVVTNVYPSYDNLYRNGFIHTRVRAYREHGRKVEVLLPSRTSRSTFREFEDVDVAEVPIDDLSACLRSGDVDNALVHFLDPLIWQALRQQSNLKGVYVWVHGSEVQPWWRREYNFKDEDELATAKMASDARMSFWQEVFREAPDNMHFIFVSRYFAEEVFEDVGIRLPEDRFSIIHNPIDTSIFTYVPKRPEQRRRVLTIRPYASRKYANDLSVEAVRLLSDREGFSDIQFCFIGDGPLFEETLAPLRGLENVEIRRQFLTHQEIARIHKDFGVFLTPTRMDAQGVSRDEAMASGLVPVTSAVAAVPEFVDTQCGFMAEGEDAAGLAEAIWTLAHDEELFASMSRAAARRVEKQTAADVIVPKEIELFRR
ncbi:glycosyltransferase [Terrabacter sp. MAHUQ-38]|uniref:glycosyltransferase n=1 Tax=unclassified Terrabacter TaxID=2630222 RepID=UPI00165E0103|nr:glycosyltransferase [Terrabacter sp. MAHUQ-38]MBC9821933.1 glycosyltransferase [Terrabacter sp. MAHUQ-38]